jgi:GxxExxY protein
MSKVYLPLSAREEEIGRSIVDSAITVHRTLGPGLLERVYEACFCHELQKRGLALERQVVVPIVYEGLMFEEGFRLDVLVESLVICELKAAVEHHSVFEAQLLSYLKLTKKRLGYLLNFHSRLMKDGIKRLVI